MYIWLTTSAWPEDHKRHLWRKPCPPHFFFSVQPLFLFSGFCFGTHACIQPRNVSGLVPAVLSPTDGHVVMRPLGCFRFLLLICFFSMCVLFNCVVLEACSGTHAYIQPGNVTGVTTASSGTASSGTASSGTASSGTYTSTMG